ncbi:MAG: TauD/TfdA family dioxygenase [Acidobacteriota bacterium]
MTHGEENSASKWKALKRRPVVVSANTLVKTDFLHQQQTLPLVIHPAVKRLDLIAWAAQNRELIKTNLVKYGGLLFRNFNVRTAAALEQLIVCLCAELLEYRERSSPRTQISGKIYTSTDYPANQSIFLHNENSYQNTWPMKIFFFCAQAAEQGGETPIADCRKIYARIAPAIRERFIEKGWMYIRNFGDGFGLPWQTVLQTTEKAAVEEHCAKNNITVEWKGNDRLRLRAVRPVIARHPLSGEMVWFNHATFFHVSTLEPSIREALVAEFKEEDLPTNTCYGDGSSIEPEVLDHLRDAYRQETIAFPWQEGDILMLDNMLVAHGRAPYAGVRRIMVGMAEPSSDRGI